MMRPNYVVKLIFIAFYMMMMMVISTVTAQVIPTDEWVNFYSRNSIFQGAPVSVGAVIDAFDSDGIQCGTFTVTKQGQYGFLLVYRDASLTENLDEGANPGDTITFKINSIPVKALGPDPSVWTQNGDIWEIDLADNLSPTFLDSIKDLVMIEDAPDTIIADLDTIFFDPENDSLIFSAMIKSAGVLPIIDEEHRLNISVLPNWSGQATLIITAQDAWFQIRDTVAIQVFEINDPPVIHDLPDTSFSSDSSLTIDLNQYVLDVDHPISSLDWKAEVLPPYEASLLVKIDNINKVATFSTNYFFSALVKVVFTVTDDSSGSDEDTIKIQVKFPAEVESNDNSPHPKNFSLSQNYPNPFNTETLIRYQLPETGYVVLQIFNTNGQEVQNLGDAEMEAGSHEITWHGTDYFGRTLPSGIYLVQIQVGKYRATRKMILLK